MIATLSLWQHITSVPEFPTLNRNETTDICIIGGGIAGLSAAFHLGKSGRKVLLLEDGKIAHGQTIRTTGHLSNALDDRYTHLESYFGKEGAKLAAEAHTYSIQFVDAFVKKHEVSCDFSWLSAYLFVPPGEPTDILEKEQQAALNAGLKVEMLERAPIQSFDTGPCLCFQEQAEFSPLPFINELCHQITQQGGSIYTYAHAAQLEEIDGGYKITTAQGHAVLANHVVIATNSPVFSPFLPHLKQAPYTTYVIAGKIPKGTLKRGLYYDTPDPYHYIRIFPSDETFDLLIIGGEDHRVAEEQDIPSRYERLEQWSRERFPDLQEITYRWSGQILEPIDSLGFIGRVKKGSEIYMITGDSGNGLTHGIFAGHLVDDLIHKRQNPAEKLFDPHRITLKAAPDFIEENANSFCQYKDWLTEGKATENQIPNNCGAIIQSGLHKCAVYRDEKGIVHKMSAVCPHLKAIVRWNAIEHCWECPAHGSRFCATGEVLQGPANEDLYRS